MSKIPDREQMRTNYEQLIQTFSVTPSDSLLQNLENLPTTHAFGDEVFTSEGPVFPYREILFEDQALLSDEQQELRKEKRRNPTEMWVAREYGLHQFVFSYLGGHQQYYAKSLSALGYIPIPAFGVFIPATEEIEGSHAVKADLGSPVFNDDEDRSQAFLLPEEARKYAAYLIEQEYGGDLWRYWGNPTHRHEPKYLNSLWEHFVEFHFPGQVEVSKLGAILWPYQKIALAANVTIDLTEEMKEELEQFRTAFPQVTVYLYEWDDEYADTRLLLASFLISQYYNDRKAYPPEAWFADRYQQELEQWQVS